MSGDPFDDDVLDDDLAEDLDRDVTNRSEDDESGLDPVRNGSDDSARPSGEDSDEPTDDPLTPISDQDDGDISDTGQGGDESYFAIVKSRTRSGGEWLGGTVAMGIILPTKLVVNGVIGTVRGFTRVIPGTQSIWKRVIRIGYNGFYKSSGADLVGHVMKEGRLKQVPMTWNNEKHRFEAGDGDWWLAPGENEHTLLGPGNTPCAWAASSATNLGTQVQAEVAEALDFGYGTRLFTNANVTFLTIKNEDGAGGAASSQQAMADGGGVTKHISVEQPGVLDDHVVPISKIYDDGEGNEAAGRLVSMEKYYETYPETVDSEEMKKQEDRGRLAEMDKGEITSFAIKMMLLAALIIAIVLLGPDVVQYLLGSGGGGGGGGGGFPGLMLSAGGG